MNIQLMGHDVSGLVSAMPTLVLVLAGAVLVIVIIGLFSRVRDMISGRASALDYVGMALMLAFLVIIGLALAKVYFKGPPLP